MEMIGGFVFAAVVLILGGDIDLWLIRRLFINCVGGLGALIAVFLRGRS